MCLLSAWFCHDFREQQKGVLTPRSRFSRVLELADKFLFDQGLHPVFGILEGNKVVHKTPTAFVESIYTVDGKLPKPLYDLLPYTIEEGEELCSDDFKEHLIQYVKVFINRAPVVKRKALKKAKQMVKKYRNDPR